ncbi:MAG TPA: hypothetical protein VFU37_18150 [Pyrinomonadaceae bacterium]|nr:hypothetical protein [Pyrinomonadaceae bacterium]
MKQIFCKYRRMLAPIVLILFLGTLAAAQSGDGATRNRMATTAPASQPSTRRVFVHSTSLLVRAAVVEDKLLKSSEFKQMGFLITRDPLEADLVLELRHDLLTKYVFTVIDAKTMTVIAGGKLSSVGGTVAGKVAKRFVKEMKSTS